MMSIIMAKTSTVSVRDLKENVRDLVSRAARGERIVVTRYGTPRAVLCPVDVAPAEAPEREGAVSTDHAFEREERAFDRMLRRGTLAAHRGRYVAVSRGRVIDADPDAATLVRRAGRRLGRRVFFVGFVGPEEPLVDLPGQELR
jgi:prevent-host-death family protein